MIIIRQLPLALLKHLGVPDAHKGLALGSIITAASLFVVDGILDADGIIEIPGISPSDGHSEYELSWCESDDNTDLETVTSSEFGVRSRNVASTSYSRRSTGNSSRNHSGHFQHFDQFISSLATLLATSTFPQSSGPPERPDLYKKLLDAVVRQARSMEGIPAAGQVLIAPLATEVWIDASLAVSSNTPGEHLFKIGAAGELFIYELLKRVLDLPDFGLDNWESQIRNRIALHEEYHDVGATPTGRETADIVYKDTRRTLTELLLAKDFFDGTGTPFDARPLIGDKPTYYIEVKTTPANLESPFYCSHGQFATMERMSLKPGERADEVYLIARVFRLGASGMGLKLYMDPARLKRSGMLKFSAEKYTITPGI